jgi:hypothetical protein
MNNKVSIKGESADQRKEYAPPVIATLGKIEDLTHGALALPVPDLVTQGSQ